MRKLAISWLIAGTLVGAVLGQAPSPKPAPTPSPAPAPTPAPTPIPIPPTPVPIAIQGELSVACYGFLRLELTGDYTSAGWMVFPKELTGADLVSSYSTTWADRAGKAHSIAIVGGKPGSYNIGVFAATTAGIQTLQTVGMIQPPPEPPAPPPSPTPGPGPAPAPVPAPTPAPVAGKFWAIAVLNFASGQPQPAIFASPTLGGTVSGLGGQWLKWDANDPSVQATAWMTAAKKQGVPSLVVVNQDGTVHSTLPLPVDEAGVVTAIKGALGKR